MWIFCLAGKFSGSSFPSVSVSKLRMCHPEISNQQLESNPLNDITEPCSTCVLMISDLDSCMSPVSSCTVIPRPASLWPKLRTISAANAFIGATYTICTDQSIATNKLSVLWQRRDASQLHNLPQAISGVIFTIFIWFYLVLPTVCQYARDRYGTAVWYGAGLATAMLQVQIQPVAAVYQLL